MNEQVRTKDQLKELVPGQMYYVTFQVPGGPRREMVALYKSLNGNMTTWSLRPVGGEQVLYYDHLIKISGPTGRKLMKPRRLGD